MCVVGYLSIITARVDVGWKKAVGMRAICSRSSGAGDCDASLHGAESARKVCSSFPEGQCHRRSVPSPLPLTIQSSLPGSSSTRVTYLPRTK